MLGGAPIGSAPMAAGRGLTATPLLYALDVRGAVGAIQSGCITRWLIASRRGARPLSLLRLSFARQRSGLQRRRRLCPGAERSPRPGRAGPGE